MRAIPTRALLAGTLVFAIGGFVTTALATSPAVIALAVVVLGVAAPVSWTATIHVGRETIPPERGGVVLAGASGGAVAGIVVNGILVQTSGAIHSWRVSFWFAAGAALIAVALILSVFPASIDRPSRDFGRTLARFKRVLGDPSGVMIVLTSAVSGLSVLVLGTFLTATSIDEMGSSSAGAATLLWVGGMSGVVAAIVFGRLGDQKTPIFAIAAAMASYAGALALLTAGWSYEWLLVAVVGYGILNGPVWGLMGAAANRRFNSALGVGAVSLGLVAASLAAALGNTAAAIWLDDQGSMRGPVAVLALATSMTSLYLIRESRRPV